MLLSRRAILPFALLPWSPAQAHHGFTGRYDTDRPILLAGTVRSVAVQPPHPALTIQVEAGASFVLPEPMPAEMTGRPDARAADAGRDVTVEFPPVRTFFDLGGVLRVGDRVDVIALRNCRPPHQLRSQWLRLGSGQVIERTGRLSYMARGCDG